MGKKKDTLTISLPKYDIFSPLIPIAYGAKWLWGENYTSVNALPPLIHAYHFFRSVYDRYDFHYKGENTCKFINKDFSEGENKYLLTGIKYNYGLSIPEMVSVAGLISDGLGFLATKESWISGINSQLAKIKEGLTLTQDHLEKASNYSMVTMFTLVGLNLLLGSSSAHVNINYDVFSPEIEVPYDSDPEPLEIINYDYDCCGSYE